MFNFSSDGGTREEEALTVTPSLVVYYTWYSYSTVNQGACRLGWFYHIYISLAYSLDYSNASYRTIYVILINLHHPQLVLSCTALIFQRRFVSANWESNRLHTFCLIAQ